MKYQGPEIECQLFEQSLSNSEHISYEALSYVWGSSELVECIILDRKQFWITDNLYSALQRLQMRDRDRYLWIDAICINQADKEEQSRQVQRMGSIYGLAEGVLFWLGKATLEITTLMDALNQHQPTTADCDLRQWMLDDNRLDVYRTGLRQLLRRQWFTRIWILQEVANARKAVVCSGTRSVPAEIFARAPSMIREQPEPHCQAVLDIMPGAHRSESWWDQERDLCTLLRRFQASKATDEHDKIYALLGLSSDPLDIQSIDIDYQKPTHQTIARAVTYLLRSTPFPVHEVLNLMNYFETLETAYFVFPSKKMEATEFLSPHLLSGDVLNKPGELKSSSLGIAVVRNPALFLFEKRPERDLKEEETCYRQLVRQMNNTSEDHEFESALEVYSWGISEHGVKIVVIHNRKVAVLYAALQGYTLILKQLLHLDLGDDERKELAEGALELAIQGEHILAIHLILHQTTPVSLRDEIRDSAFQAAARGNNKHAVKLLLDAGADVNAQNGMYGNALQAAAATDRLDVEVVKLLLDAGADVNAQGGKYGNALYAAVVKNKFNDKAVKLLLDAGADVNAQGGKYGNALQAALFVAYKNNRKTVTHLLNAGANVHARGGHYGNALQAAALRGNEWAVKMFLKKGADVNAQGGHYGNALQAVSDNGEKKVVMLLLNAGANVNAQGGHYGNALQVAASRGDEWEVKMLLKKGADVNAQGGHYGNALQAVVHLGHEGVIQLLLDAGADVNSQGGYYSNALLMALLSNCRKKAVQLLLDAGADVNAECGKYGNALQAAAYDSNKEIVQLLLDAGADINAQGGKYGSALQAAAASKYSIGVVNQLLNASTIINAQDGEFGNSLQAATKRRNKEVMKLLIGAGADVNAPGGKYGNALQQAAAIEDNDEVVQLLLDAGAKSSL
jgi:ankyrin repeat protein